MQAAAKSQYQRIADYGIAQEAKADKECCIIGADSLLRLLFPGVSDRVDGRKLYTADDTPGVVNAAPRPGCLRAGRMIVGRQGDEVARKGNAPRYVTAWYPDEEQGPEFHALARNLR